MGFYNGIINKYKDYLPIGSNTPIITLHEGNTPLLQLKNLSKKLGNNVKIYGKFEGMNPTGSFKDRGISLTISKAKEEKKEAVICASTGNTSASAAAYSAKAGIKCIVIIPEDVPEGKLAQALIYGATVIQVKNNFDVCLKLVKQLAVELPLTIVNCTNPYRVQGQKTAAFEVVEALGDAPDYHCFPVGNAANLVSNWTGYNEYKNVGFSSFLPKMIGYQAEFAAPIIKGEKIIDPKTVASAIRVGDPQLWSEALEVEQGSSGWFEKVTDEEILSAQYTLSNLEGIFVEPASAAGVAGMINDIKSEKIKSGSVVVCTLTGNGLKDPDIAVKNQVNKLKKLTSDFDIIKENIMKIL